MNTHPDTIDALKLDDATTLTAKLDLATKNLAPGKPFCYTITVKNDGTNAATGVAVTEGWNGWAAEGTVAFVDGSASQGEFDGLTWNVGTLEPGQIATAKVSGVPAAHIFSDAESITNVASPEVPADAPRP